MFSIFHRILVRPLPVPEPARLVHLTEPGPKAGTIGCSFAGLCGYAYLFSYPMLRDLEAEQNVFTGIAGHDGLDVNLAHGERGSCGRPCRATRTIGVRIGSICSRD